MGYPYFFGKIPIRERRGRQSEPDEAPLRSLRGNELACPSASLRLVGGFSAFGAAA
jgi:hypothetical protein